MYNRALRVTRAGWYFMGFIFAFGIAAINTGNNLLYLILAVMLGVVVASGVLSEEVVRRLRVERTLPAEAWSGEEFKIYYSLENPRKWFTSYGIRISEGSIEAMREAFILQALPKGRGVSEGVYIAGRRGKLPLNELRFATKFPFGFFEKIRLIDMLAEIIVFPKPAAVAANFVSGNKIGLSEHTGAFGEGPDLHSIRPYVAGDNPHSIHWKASAKTESMVVKVTRSENMPTMTIMLDVAGYRKDIDEDALERAISETAGYAKYFHESGYMLRLVTDSGETPFGSGKLHFKRIMTDLALYAPFSGGANRKHSIRAGENIVTVSLKRRAGDFSENVSITGGLDKSSKGIRAFLEKWF